MVVAMAGHTRLGGTVPAMVSPTPPPPAGPDRDGPDRDGPGPTRDDQRPEFGPGGYLPGRAAARARKIVLRAPLGLQWVVGALVAGVAVLVAGIAWWSSSGPPEEPFVATVAVADAGAAAELDGLDALLVTAGGTAAVFADAAALDLAWCPDSRRIEGTVDGRAATWQAGTGRGYGVASLDRRPVVVHDGTAYVDPTRRVPGPRPAPDREPLACS